MTIPESIRDFVREIFRGANLRVSNKLSKQPSAWETSLDITLIEHLSNYASPIIVEKNWVVRVDTHYLGGMRHWGRWEIADIGILLIFRRNGKTVRSKIALLQSKRLYPNEVISEDEDGQENYIIGFGRLYESDKAFEKIITPRTLSFSDGSKYSAIKVKDEQWEAMKDFQKRTTIPIHYLFYNPCQVPHEVELPLTTDINFTSFSVGARVLPATHLFDKFDNEAKNYVPSLGELKYILDAPFNEIANEGGWRLEDFVADHLITCKEGYIVKDDQDFNLETVFNRRSGPIAAAFSITFDLTE